MKKYFLLIITVILCFTCLTACEWVIPQQSSNTTVDNPVKTNTDITPATNTELETNSSSNTVQEPTYTEIRVSTAKDIFQNLKPYTRIILTGETYNLSEIDTTTFQCDYVRADDAYDGFEFVIHDLDHFEICAAPNVLPEIVTPGAHVNPISLSRCHDVKIDGIVSGHTVEKGSCSGAVIQLQDCSDIAISDCHLYGCGIYGIVAYNSKNVTVDQSEIYECSYGLLDLNNSSNFVFNNCIFRDSQEYDMFSLYQCNAITFNNCTISWNHCVEDCAMVSCNESTNVNFNKCIFSNNLYSYLTIGEEAKFNGCKIDDQHYEYQGEYYPDSDYDYEEYYYDIEDTEAEG